MSTEKTALQKRLEELAIINPDNLKCSSCSNYPGWVSSQCKSINPLFFCEKHTQLKPENVYLSAQLIALKNKFDKRIESTIIKS